MKSPWMQTLAWIAAVGAAILLAMAGPDEASLVRGGDMPRVGR